MADLYACGLRAEAPAAQPAFHILLNLSACYDILQRSPALAGWAEATAAVVRPQAVVALLEAVVPPLLTRELALDGALLMSEAERGLALDRCKALGNVVMSLSRSEEGCADPSPGARALAARPQLLPDLLRLLACQLRRLAATPELQSDPTFHPSLLNGLQSLKDGVALLAAPPAALAPWAMEQHATVMTALGTQPHEGADGQEHTSLLFESGAVLFSTTYRCFHGLLYAAAPVKTGLRLPLQAVDALRSAVAVLMLAADAMLPEARFKGAAAALEAWPGGAPPWEERGAPAAPAEFATAAEVCAAQLRRALPRA